MFRSVYCHLRPRQYFYRAFFYVNAVSRRLDHFTVNVVRKIDKLPITQPTILILFCESLETLSRVWTPPLRPEDLLGGGRTAAEAPLRNDER